MAAESSGKSNRWFAVWIGIGVVLLLFAPLLLSIVEGLLFESNRVEGFFRDIGLHDFLTAIYRPIMEPFFK